jgi:hypothetical protein
VKPTAQVALDGLSDLHEIVRRARLEGTKYIKHYSYVGDDNLDCLPVLQRKILERILSDGQHNALGVGWLGEHAFAVLEQCRV